MCSLFKDVVTLVHVAKGRWDFNFVPTHGVSIKPLKVELLAGEQKATEVRMCKKANAPISRQAQFVLGLDLIELMGLSISSTDSKTRLAARTPRPIELFHRSPPSFV